MKKENKHKYTHLIHTHVFSNSAMNFVYPGMIGVFIFTLLPLADVIGRSFICADGIGLKNYRMLLSNEAFQLAAANTIKFEMLALPLLFVISLMVAFVVLDMNNNIIKFLFLIPMAIPSNSIAVIWKLFFDDSGIVNGILVNIFHGKPIDFMQGNAAFLLLVGTFLWKNIGYCMLLWLTGLSVFPKEISEAAQLDGAGNFTVFFKIIMPNLKNTIYIVIMLSLVNSFKIFREVYLIAGNYPDSSIYFLQHLFNNWFGKLEIGKLAAGACITAIGFFSILLILRKLIFRDTLSIMRHGGR